MALSKILLFIAIFAVVRADYNEVEAKNKTQEALAAKREQRARFAAPEPVRGSFQKLTNLMNRTEERNSRRRKQNINKIFNLNRRQKTQNDANAMLNDKDGAIAINQRTFADNITNTYVFSDKMKALRPEVPTYEAIYKNNYIPPVTGVFCDFEKQNGSMDMCKWQWNSTVSNHGLGFSVMTASDIVGMNTTTRGLKFTGPETDADGNKEGEIWCCGASHEFFVCQFRAVIILHVVVF